MIPFTGTRGHGGSWHLPTSLGISGSPAHEGKVQPSTGQAPLGAVAMHLLEAGAGGSGGGENTEMNQMDASRRHGSGGGKTDRSSSGDTGLGDAEM